MKKKLFRIEEGGYYTHNYSYVLTNKSWEEVVKWFIKRMGGPVSSNPRFTWETPQQEWTWSNLSPRVQEIKYEEL